MNLKDILLQTAIRLLLIIVCFFLLLFFILTYRAYVVYKPCEHNVKPLDAKNKIRLDDGHLKRLQKAISFPTESLNHDKENFQAKVEFVNFVRSEFKDLEQFSFVTLHIINNYSLLYKIEGTNKSLKPYLLAAHYDVVPADGTDWDHGPYSGKIDRNFLYGRGTMDDKASMISQLEAVRFFLNKTKRQPNRTLYLAYGHDEEISGLNGARHIAKLLESNNVSLEYVLDEGSMVVEDLLQGSEKPTAVISVADKGYLTIKFYVNVTGGHSSMPNLDNSALIILSEAITKLKNTKTPGMLKIGPERILLETLGVNLGFSKRLVLTNIWLFEPILEYVFSKVEAMNAIQRTTTAVTMFHGGVKENVMPAYAEFVVNHRIHSLQSCAEILDFDLKAINDPRVQFEVLNCVEPSKISPSDSEAYRLIEHATMKLFSDAIAAPGVMLGLTDSRFYSNLTKNVYKYLPVRIVKEDLKRYHGVNERISIQNYEDMINFYYVLINDTNNLHLTNQTIKEHSEL